MTSPSRDSLARFREQLERAVERDRRAGRRRHVTIRMAAAAAAGVAVTVGVASLPGDDTTVSPPSASAAQRAAAVLSSAPGAIVHEVATYRQVAPDGSVSAWRTETWRQTSRPYARRELTTRGGGTVIEIATAGDRATRLYDRAANTIYTNPPQHGPAVGTPMPARDGDPLREQLLQLLRSVHADRVTRSRAGARAVLRFAYDNPLPDGGAVEWTYVVDADTYQPIRMTSSSPDGSRTTVRFRTYEALEPTRKTRALLDLREQHPDAAIDRTRAGYEAAQARMSSMPTRRGG